MSLTMQCEILLQRSLTNVILVFGCIAQSRIMTDKNGTGWHDVGLRKRVALSYINSKLGVTVTSAHTSYYALRNVATYTTT